MQLDSVSSDGQSFRNADGIRVAVLKASDLAAETRSSAIASIIQPMNKLTQGPAVNAESVVRSLRAN